MFRGNVDNVMAEADKIVRRLRETDVTMTELKIEYHCKYETLARAVKKHLSPAEYRRRVTKGSWRGKNRKYNYVPKPETQIKVGRVNILRAYYDKADGLIDEIVRGNRKDYPIPVGHNKRTPTVNWLICTEADMMLESAGFQNPYFKD